MLAEDIEGPGERIYDVLRATEMVVPALEIIDCRAETPRTFGDAIAGNAAFAAIIVGDAPVRP